MLFIFFRALKCALEANIRDCGANATAAFFISTFIIMRWMLLVAHGWVKKEVMSIEEVARGGIGLRRAAEGALLAVLALSGAFLFTLMSAKEPNVDLVIAVGTTGAIAGGVCLVSEIYTVIKEQERRRRMNSTTRPAAARTEELDEYVCESRSDDLRMCAKLTRGVNDSLRSS